MAQTYLYLRGNGNDGDFSRLLIQLSDRENPYAALRALLANDYVARGRVRRWIIGNVEIDGEAEYGLYATVYEGPEGQTDMGAAWVTAQLQPLTDSEVDYERAEWSRQIYTLREILDPAARRLYRQHASK